MLNTTPFIHSFCIYDTMDLPDVVVQRGSTRKVSVFERIVQAFRAAAIVVAFLGAGTKLVVDGITAPTASQ